MKTLKKILYMLSPNESKQAALLLLMILIMAFLEMLGVASILPFIAVLSNPDLIETNLILKKIFKFSNNFGIENNKQFLIASGVFVFIILVTSLAFKAMTIYVQIRFTKMREYSIGKRLIEGYLHQPYSWFLNRHSADLGKNILSEVSFVSSNAIGSVMQLIAKSLVSIALVILLVLADPNIALVAGIVLLITYGLIYKFTRKYLFKIGKEREKNNQLRFTAISEAFGAAKEVKVGGLEETYVERFSNPAKTFAKTQASAAITSQLPRFILETVIFGGIMLLLIYLVINTGSFNSALPTISLYVVAGYRLVPALQEVYASFTQLAFVGPALDKLYDDISSLKPINSKQEKGKL